MSKVSARWLPRLLTPEPKYIRLAMLQTNLTHFEADPASFLERFLSQDECWVHHFEPETRRQSMKWKSAMGNTMPTCWGSYERQSSQNGLENWWSDSPVLPGQCSCTQVSGCNGCCAMVLNRLIIHTYIHTNIQTYKHTYIQYAFSAPFP